MLPRDQKLFSADVSLKVKQDPKLNPYANGLPDDPLCSRNWQSGMPGFLPSILKHRD